MIIGILLFKQVSAGTPCRQVRSEGRAMPNQDISAQPGIQTKLWFGA
jgi:hypothetical protein